MSTLSDCRILDGDDEKRNMLLIIDSVCQEKNITDDLKQLRFYNEVNRGYLCLKSANNESDLIQKYNRTLKKRVSSLFVKLKYIIYL